MESVNSLRGQYAPVVGLFLEQMKKGEPLTIVPDGEQRRDFTHVSDAGKCKHPCVNRKTRNTDKFSMSGLEQIFR